MTLLHAASERWNPRLVEPAGGRIREFVDWDVLTSYLRQSTDDSLYLHLRPISLARWLKIANNR